ncbi:MAG: glycosyltransferase family 4 protein [Acidobacteriaceae bacterium]
MHHLKRGGRTIVEQNSTKCLYASIGANAELDLSACRADGLKEQFSAGEKKVAHCYHVLYLIDQLTEMGGAERSLLKMVAHLPPDKVRATVITFRENVHPVAKAALGDLLQVIPLRRSYDVNALSAAWRLRKFIRSEKVDIVQTFFETSDIWGSAVARLSGVRVLVSGRRDMSIRRSFKHRMAYRFLGCFYDRVVTVSDAVRAQVIERENLDPEKVITLHSGTTQIPSSAASSVCKSLSEYGIPDDAAVVLTVANVLPWKGHWLFLQACTLLHTKFPCAHFVVAGAFTDKQLLEKLLSEVDRCDLQEYVHFLGSVEDVGGLLRRARVFCLLSDSEGFPNAVLEAMAAGVPVVATDVGGTGEAVHDGCTGFLVPLGRPDLVADRIAQLLRSPELCDRFGQAGREKFLEKFTVDEMMRKWMDLYEDLMARTD